MYCRRFYMTIGVRTALCSIKGLNVHLQPLSLSLGTVGDLSHISAAKVDLHTSRFSTVVSTSCSVRSIDVRSLLTVSRHLCLCLPCFLLPPTVVGSQWYSRGGASHCPFPSCGQTNAGGFSSAVWKHKVVMSARYCALNLSI